jgi:hypothetical protein
MRGGCLLLDRLDLEMETDEREDQALEILDQVVETPTKKAIKITYRHVPVFLDIKTVLRIRDVYPGFRILIFVHPGSRIQKQQQKEMGDKNLFSYLVPFVVATNIRKL